LLLGLDLGTTNIKALVVREDGAIAAQGSVPVSLRHADGGVEQDMDEIWRATVNAIRAAGREASLADVRAVGVSSQGGALQVRAADGRCVGSVVSWMDTRGCPFDEDFQQRVGEAWLTRHIGHGASAMSIGQIQRLRRTQPDSLKRPNRVNFVGDTIVERLCGRAAHDCSSLSIACLYNPHERRADPDLLRELGLDDGQLPHLLGARETAGSITAAAAHETGLPAGIPIGPAIHDQYAAAVGCGAVEAGDVMFGCGTAWVLVAIADHLPALVSPSAWACDHAVPDRWGQLLSLVVGGSAFRWALDMTGLLDAPRERTDAMIASVAPGSDGLRFWPFLDALGGPRRPVGGRLDNLRLSHGPAHLLRSVLEGLCSELARQLSWLEAAGCPVRRLIMCGGAARSAITPGIVADVTGRPVLCPRESEISAFGSAVLARALVEPAATIDRLHHEMAGSVRTVEPGPAAASYRDPVQRYIKDLS
jgi:xylulokinase